MKRLTNKKGAIEPVALGWMGMVVINIIISQLPPIKQDFRTKKAIKMCVVQEVLNEEECQSAVASMSKDQILAYIKDDEIPENKGFAEGKKAPDFTNISKTRGVPSY